MTTDYSTSSASTDSAANPALASGRLGRGDGHLKPFGHRELPIAPGSTGLDVATKLMGPVGSGATGSWAAEGTKVVFTGDTSRCESCESKSSRRERCYASSIRPESPSVDGPRWVREIG